MLTLQGCRRPIKRRGGPAGPQGRDYRRKACSDKGGDAGGACPDKVGFAASAARFLAAHGKALVKTWCGTLPWAHLITSPGRATHAWCQQAFSFYPLQLLFSCLPAPTVSYRWAHARPALGHGLPTMPGLRQRYAQAAGSASQRHPGMTRCRGWHEPCGELVEYVVHWAYDGAELYPSEHGLCRYCVRCAHAFLSRQVGPKDLRSYWWRRLEYR